MSRTQLKHYSPGMGRGERGMALVLCLVVLIVLTIFGIAALNTSVNEESMARNTQESVQAFQHSETGMAQAAKYINLVLTQGMGGGAGAGATPTPLPETHRFGDVEKEIESLPDGSSGELGFRMIGNESTDRAQCGEVITQDGCVLFYEYSSKGRTELDARASLYGGGCVTSPLGESTGVFNEDKESQC